MSLLSAENSSMMQGQPHYTTDMEYTARDLRRESSMIAWRLNSLASTELRNMFLLRVLKIHD